jgi:hypothetical protein
MRKKAMTIDTGERLKPARLKSAVALPVRSGFRRLRAGKVHAHQ